jgi:pimeloyl-ACP methyl ester carboxylesterase
MQISANGLSIEVDDQGPAAGPVIVLIMGLGMQLVAWPEPFVQMLVARGFRVVRLDNRDAGLSQGFDAAGVPSLAWAGMRHAFHLPVYAPYSLDDMAADTLGVMDALGIAAAHVVGASMGGMIAQLMALAAPQRVLSVTLMMTSPGERGLPGPSARARAAMLNRPPPVRGLPGPGGPTSRPDPRDVPALVEHLLKLLSAIGSPGFVQSPELMRPRLELMLARAWRPQGTVRQLIAILAAPGRASALAGCRLPAQVIHGLADPLVPIAHGRALARAIPGARLHEIDGMGHDLPPQLWQTFAEHIDSLARPAV